MVTNILNEEVTPVSSTKALWGEREECKQN